MVMEFIRNPWVWGAAYLVMGLLFCAYHATSEWLAKRSQPEPFLLPPWTIEGSARQDEPGRIETVVAILVFMVIWLPALIG